MAKTPNNQKRTYTTRLQKGGAVIEDMRVFVRGRCDEGDDGASDNEHMLQNVLGKTTRVRAKDVYCRAFVPRFVNGDPRDAWKLTRPLEDREVASEVLTPLYYWVTARAEPILYDFVADFVLDRSKSHDPGVRVDETTQWITGKLKERKQAWSETVRIKMARGMLAALRDFGILEGKIKKRVAPVYLPVESFAYLAFLLHTLGSDGASLVNHPDWRLHLLSPQAVERMFLDADQNHLLKFEAAGRVYRIEFPAETPEEMADVIS